MSLNDWLDKIGITLPEKIEALNGIKIGSGNQTKNSEQIIYQPQINIITINNPQVLPGPQKIATEKLISESFEEGEIILDEESDKTIADLIIAARNPKTKEILGFYREKITSEDLIILELSLYLRNVFESGDRNQCRRIKQDILNRFGKRGSNISNLCTAGYFESDITPLFKLLEKEDGMSRENFSIIFNDLVNNFPTAVFINTQMSKEEVKTEIVSQIETNKKHGINYLVIHGIGHLNVQRIEEAILEIESVSNFKGKEVNKTKSIVRIRVDY